MGLIIYSNNIDPTSSTISEGRTSGGLVDSDTDLGLPIPPREEDPQFVENYFALSGLSIDNNMVGFGTGTTTSNITHYSGAFLKDIWTDDSQVVSFFVYSGDSTLLNETWKTVNATAFLAIKSGSTVMRGVNTAELTDQFPSAYITPYINNYQTLNVVNDIETAGLDLCGSWYDSEFTPTSETVLTSGTRMFLREQTFSTQSKQYPWEFFGRFLLSDFVYTTLNSTQYRPVSYTLTDSNGDHWPVPDITAAGLSGYNYLYVIYKFTQRVSETESLHYYTTSAFELPSRFNNYSTYYGIDQDTLKIRPFHGLSVPSWNPTIGENFNYEARNKNNSGYSYTVADKSTLISVVQDAAGQFGIDWYYPGGDGLLINGSVYSPTEYDEGLVSNTTVTVEDNSGTTYGAIPNPSYSLIFHFSKRVNGSGGYSSGGMVKDEISVVSITGTVESSVLSYDSGTTTGDLYVLHTKLYDVVFALSSKTTNEINYTSLNVKANVEPIEAVMRASNRVDSDKPGLMNFYVNWGDGNEDEIQWSGSNKALPTGITHTYSVGNKSYSVYMSAATVEQLSANNPGYPLEVFEKTFTVNTKPTMKIREDGLCYRWGFDGDDWLSDAMGNANLTVAAGQLQEPDGIIGGCVSAMTSAALAIDNPLYIFTGPHSAHTMTTSNDWTVCFWVKDPNTGTTLVGDRKIIKQVVGVNDTLVFGYTVESDGQHYLLYNNTQTTFPSSVWDGAPTLNTNTWKHLAYVKDGNRVRFYVDGSFMFQDTVVGMYYANNDEDVWRIGDPNTEVFIDEVRIYNRPLTQREVYEQSLALVFDSDFYAPGLDSATVLNDSSSNWNRYFVPTCEYEYSPFVATDLYGGAKTNEVRYQSGTTQNGYVNFGSQIGNTLSYNDVDRIFESNGNSEITISTDSWKIVGAESDDYCWIAIDTGNTQADQVFAVNVINSTPTQTISISINTVDGKKTLSNLASNFIIKGIDDRDRYIYTIQLAGSDGSYAYRLIRNKSIIDQGIVSDPGVDYSFNFGGGSEYNIRLFPKYGLSETNQSFRMKDLKIYKSRVDVNSIYDRLKLNTSFEEGGGCHFPNRIEDDDTITNTTSGNTIWIPTTIFKTYDEIGPTDGLIGYYKFDGNLDDSSFSGNSLTPAPDGLHRFFDGGFNKRSDRGLFIHGDVYNSGGTNYELDQYHSMTLVEDVYKAGTVFLATRDLNYGESTISTLVNVDLFNLDSKDFGLIVSYTSGSTYEYGDVLIKIGSGGYLTSKNYEADSGWNTYILTWDDSVSQNIYYYKNGTLDSIATYSITSPVTGLTLFNNTKAESHGFNMAGVIGELRVYSKKLSDSEVLQLDNMFKKEMCSIDSGMTLHTTGHMKER